MRASIVSRKFVENFDVIPAGRTGARESRSPGKYKEKTWIPAFAGMTKTGNDLCQGISGTAY
jgi:hypothetical protein